MFLELIFCAALNMSLPEFQPQEDLSGNYIVGTYDVSENEFYVDDVTTSDISFSQDLSSQHDGLSVDGLRSMLLEASRSTQLVDKYIFSQTLSNHRISQKSDGTYEISYHSGRILNYIQLDSGITYTITAFDSPLFYSTSISGTHIPLTELSSNVVTPDTTIYVTGGYGSIYATYQVEETVTDGEVDLSFIEGLVESINDNIQHFNQEIVVIVRALLLVALVSFLYPIIISCVNYLKGGKNV